jgi:hypothetical protein
MSMNKRLGLQDKLVALQESDSYRKWYSLDDRRVCVLCEKLISGRMIDVWQDDIGTFLLHCPTPGCPGTPRDWFYCGLKRSHQPNPPAHWRPILDFDLSGKSTNKKMKTVKPESEVRSRRAVPLVE